MTTLRTHNPHAQTFTVQDIYLGKNHHYQHFNDLLHLLSPVVPGGLSLTCEEFINMMESLSGSFTATSRHTIVFTGDEDKLPIPPDALDKVFLMTTRTANKTTTRRTLHEVAVVLGASALSVYQALRHSSGTIFTNSYAIVNPEEEGKTTPCVTELTDAPTQQVPLDPLLILIKNTPLEELMRLSLSRDLLAITATPKKCSASLRTVMEVIAEKCIENKNDGDPVPYYALKELLTRTS